MATIDDTAFFTIENLDAEPFTYRFQGRTITLQPNHPKAIPFIQMIRLCGDPRSGTDDRNKLRRDAVERLRQFYGIYDDAYAWENRPKLKVTDEDGNVVSTPLWDPEGQPSYESDEPVNYEMLVQKMARQEREMAALKQQMEVELQAMQAVREGQARADVAPIESPLALADSRVGEGEAPTASQSRRTKARPPETGGVDESGVPVDGPDRPKVS